MTDAIGPEQRLSSHGKPLAEFTIRPDRGVVLKETIDPVFGKTVGVNAKFPFTDGRRLYGWPDHPGLYCDLLRNRCLGSVAACLYDGDQDGRFEEGLRFEFDSRRADLVFITDKQKTRGAAFKGSIKLSVPLRYENITDEDFPSAKMKLWWDSEVEKEDTNRTRMKLKFIMSDGFNFTGTEILASQHYSGEWSGTPTTFEAYGLSINVLNYDDKAGMSYQISQIRPKEAIAFGFRGYVVEMRPTVYVAPN